MWHHTFLSTICNPLEINAPCPTHAQRPPSLIPLHTRDHTPDATSRINNITFSAWDQMYVGMEDCLTSRYFFVDTTIEACDCLR